MMLLKNIRLVAIVIIPVSFIFFVASTWASSEHDSHDETPLLSFTAQQMQLANIRVAPLTARIMSQTLYAPGEIQANGYTSYVVSPRVESVIVRRHAILGDHVEFGQALVTLFSETVADAQATYRIAYADWQRTQSLGKQVLSESQLLSVQTAYIAAFSRLKAYGLSEQAIRQVAADTQIMLGEYTLTAERSGVVFSDDFHQGQRITPGEAIMVLADESQLWVEARLSASNQTPLANGTQAQVIFASEDGDEMYQAEVIQKAHTIDAKTRTRVVRLKVNNNDHQLHPGLFVDVFFSLTNQTPVLVVPETALLRSEDGDWLVYLQQDEMPADKQAAGGAQQKKILTSPKKTLEHQVKTRSFIAQEVQLGKVYRQFSNKHNRWNNWREIQGVAENSKVAISGAFFIASQHTKSGFDPHNH